MSSIASWIYSWYEVETMFLKVSEEKDLKMSRSVVGGEEGREEPSGEQG